VSLEYPGVGDNGLVEAKLLIIEASLYFGGGGVGVGTQ